MELSYRLVYHLRIQTMPSIYPVDANGNFLTQTSTKTYDATTRAWFVEAQNKLSPVWTPLFLFSLDNTPTVSFAVPILVQDTFTYVVAANLNLSAVNTNLTNIFPDSTKSGAFVVDIATGYLIASSLTGKIYSVTPAGKKVYII